MIILFIDILILTFSRYNPTTIPKIIVDLPAMVDCFQTQLESIHGSRSSTLLSRLESVLQKFKLLGVELIFYKDGPPQAVKYETVLLRAKEKLKKAYKLFDYVENNWPTMNIIQTGSIHIFSIKNYNITKLCQQYGKVITAYNNECDAEIAYCAEMNKAIAILANDTDFLIFPGVYNINIIIIF